MPSAAFCLITGLELPFASKDFGGFIARAFFTVESSAISLAGTFFLLTVGFSALVEGDFRGRLETGASSADDDKHRSCRGGSFLRPLAAVTLGLFTAEASPEADPRCKENYFINLTQ